MLALLAIVVLGASTLVAQQTLGGVTGQVTDTSGAALPDATVTIVGEQTSLTRTTKTNATGIYTFVNLPTGIYMLTY
ncbi:MAG TPA: carboxypeptidase-like regulatory domain-containing protein, partial [Terracidiphilus sp.]|nr:carboxypeptidase-like regulatory domain-containing protein [Terracidiphilus sp.]